MHYIKRYILENSSIRFHHAVDTPEEKEYLYPPEVHEQYEVMFLVKGSVECNIAGECYNLKAGDLFLIDFHEMHSLNIDLSQGYERLVVHFKRDIIPQALSDSKNILLPFEINKSRKTRIIDSQIVKNYNIEKLFYNMKDIAYGQEKHSELLFICCILELIVELNLMFESPNLVLTEPVQVNSTVRQAISYIDLNIDKPITLDEIANHLFISKYHLCHLFKDFMNVSINKYITTKKINLADSYIESGMSAMKACYAVGYTNYTTFFLNYKKIKKKAPSH